MTGRGGLGRGSWRQGWQGARGSVMEGPFEKECRAQMVAGDRKLPTR